MNSTFASLRVHNYRLWFFAALISNLGTWMQRTAQDWVVLTVLAPQAHVAPGVAAGWVTALQFLPVLFITPYGGVLADRVNRRKLLIATQTGMGLLAFGLGALMLSGHANLYQVYLFAFLLGLVSAVDAPVRQTFVGELVGHNMLANAVGLNSASFNGARLIGPAVGGLIIAWVGAGWAFLVNGISFAATIGVILTMRSGELHRIPSAPRTKGQIRSGMKYVRGRKDIILIMLTVGIVSALGLNFQVTTGLMATQVYHVQADSYGILNSIMAIGSLAGALLAARREHPRVRLVIGSALAFGITEGALAMMPGLWSYGAVSILVGLFSLTMMTAANSTIQLSTAPEMRGRVMALYMMVFQGATPIGSPLIGWMGAQFGARWSIGVGAIASITIALIAALLAMRTWHVRLVYRAEVRPHLVIVNPASSDIAIVQPDSSESGSPATDKDHAEPPTVDDPVSGSQHAPDAGAKPPTRTE